jgi:hypothetical protein
MGVMTVRKVYRNAITLGSGGAGVTADAFGALAFSNAASFGYSGLTTLSGTNGIIVIGYTLQVMCHFHQAYGIRGFNQILHIRDVGKQWWCWLYIYADVWLIAPKSLGNKKSDLYKPLRL